jgi:hypothetical protein
MSEKWKFEIDTTQWAIGLLIYNTEFAISIGFLCFYVYRKKGRK